MCLSNLPHWPENAPATTGSLHGLDGGGNAERTRAAVHCSRTASRTSRSDGRVLFVTDGPDPGRASGAIRRGGEDDLVARPRMQESGGIPVRRAPTVPFGGDTEGTVPDLTDVLIAIAAIESRILRQVRDGAGEIPAEELTNELPRLSGDLVRLYRRLADLSDRRDLSYATQRKLHRLQNQCVWLYRKAHNELSFFKKLGLEAR